MTTKRVRLAASATFWRAALLIFIGRQCALWLMIRRLPAPPGRKLLFMLFSRRGAPRSLIVALIGAAAITFLLDLLIGLIVRPIVRRWHEPRVDPEAGLFHLGASERVVASSPARRADGRRWPPGLLLLTDRRLWFFPNDHHAEPWSRPLAELSEIKLRPVRTVGWGLVRDWPDRLTLATDVGALERFAVPDPNAVLSWFKPARGSVGPRPIHA